MNKSVLKISKEQIGEKLCLFSVKDIEAFKTKFRIKKKTKFIKDIISSLKEDDIEEAFGFIDGINYYASLEERMGELVRMFGVKNDTGGYKLYLGFKLIVDGRNIAEEYEDLDNEAPCRIDYLQIESNDTTPWFHMYTAYASYFPLASNDQYAMTAISTNKWEFIVENIVKKHGYKSNDRKVNKELKRVNWINFINKNMHEIKLRNEPCDWDKREYDSCPLSSRHLLDCNYSCFDTRDAEEYGITLEEFDEIILNSVNKTEALFLKIIYPTYDAFFDSAYLAPQIYEAWAKWKRITKMIWCKVELLTEDLDIDTILQVNPEDILVDNRLPNDPVPIDMLRKEGLKFENQEPPKIGYPKKYDESKMSWEEKNSMWQRAKKREANKVKKLGHPRFEIILPKEGNKSIALQLLDSAYCYFNNKGRYIGEDLIIPTYGAIIIDHLDKDKTPYLLGDFEIDPHGYRYNQIEFFIRVDINGEENIVEIRQMTHSSSNIRYIKMGCSYGEEALSIIHELVDKSKSQEAFDVSLRTGKTHLLTTYDACTTEETLDKLEKYIKNVKL